MRVHVGDAVADRFVIERHAAGGGMGEVYQALDRHTDRPAAVKILHGSDGPALERFVREARVLSELRHPGIVGYLDHGRTTTGELYLAMEWLAGEDLGARLAARELDFGDSLLVATRAAGALAVAHARGVVHRDVKPSNLFLVDAQPARLKLLDFGVARLGGLGRITGTGLAVGTPLYMAPEQARGAREIDARADVFSIGAVLYRCLTGRTPFTGATAAELFAALCSPDEVPPVSRFCPGAPPELVGLLERMLHKDPAARPRDGAAVLAELLPFEATGLLERRPSPGRAALDSVERRLACLVLLGAPPTPALAAQATAHGTTLEADGAGRAVARVAGHELATDLATRALRLALALHAGAPAAPIAVVTARAASTGADGDELAARAARMLDGDGAVRVDEATAGLLGGRFELHGDTGGMAVTGERDPDATGRTLLGRATPFVGRDRELALLEGLFDDCLDDRGARAVLITSPAGGGKSRLRQELVARLRARHEVEVWIGRGDPLRAGAPLAVLGEAVRRAAGIEGGETIDERRARLVARVQRHLPGERGARAAAFLGEVAAVPFSGDDDTQLRAARRDPGLLTQQVRDAWLEWLAAETAARPVLLVLEDLHWGDLPTVRMVGAALAAAAADERPLFVLAAARPEVHELFPRIWAEHALQQIQLGGLPRKAAEALAQRALGERATASIVAEVVARAGGNPFFLEELIRHAAAPASPGQVTPDSVLAMVAARFESLGHQARRALRAASVFGDVFWAGAVAALLGGASEDAVEAALAELVDAEIVQRRPAGRFAGERELGFRHALLREAAYAMFTDADRAVGHRLAGGWLAAAGESEALVVAEHLERGGERAAAAGWYARAAEQALAASDLDAALERAARAIDCDPASQAAGRARLAQAVAHRSRGDIVATRDAALAALVVLDEGGDEWHVALGEAAAACGKMFDIAGLRQVVTRLDEGHASGAPSGQRAIAFARAAAQCFLDGEPELGDALLARLEPLPPALAADAGVVAHIELSRGYRSFANGNWRRARVHHLAAAEGFARAGDVRNACVEGIEAGFYHWWLGAYQESVAHLEPLVREADRLDLHSAEAYGRAYLAVALFGLGRIDEAEREIEQALRITPPGSPRVVVGVHSISASIDLDRGRLEEAEHHLRLAVAEGERGYPPLVLALALLARVRVQRGDPAEGLALAERAVAMCSRTANRPHDADVRLAHAEAALAAGHPDAPSLIAYARDCLLTHAAELEPEERRRFLERVSIHARVMELAKQLPAGGST